MCAYAAGNLQSIWYTGAGHIDIVEAYVPLYREGKANGGIPRDILALGIPSYYLIFE